MGTDIKVSDFSLGKRKLTDIQRCLLHPPVTGPPWPGADSPHHQISPNIPLSLGPLLLHNYPSQEGRAGTRSSGDLLGFRSCPSTKKQYRLVPGLQVFVSAHDAFGTTASLGDTQDRLGNSSQTSGLPFSRAGPTFHGSEFSSPFLAVLLKPWVFFSWMPSRPVFGEGGQKMLTVPQFEVKALH